MKNTDENTITILDVGHGNCTILKSDNKVAVLDTGPKVHLLEYLREQEITEIEWVVLSHSDDDHIGGIIGLLSSRFVKVKKVRINTDSQKKSKTFDDFAHLIDKLGQEVEIDYIPSLTPRMSEELHCGNIETEIVAPSDYLATHGPGAVLQEGEKIQTNTISAVLRFSYLGKQIVLAAGDIDAIGLKDLKDHHASIPAPVLIFPHHGGFSRGAQNASRFAQDICSLVNPETVVFSIGWDAPYQNPRKEIVDTVRNYDKHIRILCTQVSRSCSSNVPVKSARHINQVYASGAACGKCCGGTLIIKLSDPMCVTPLQRDHDAFKMEYLDHTICI
jgi:beta-lactamase superfamily II metal-dependent hydrolase